MAQNPQYDQLNPELPDPRWKELYRIGWIASIVALLIVVCALIAYLIWPYTPGFTTTAEIFSKIQSNRLGALMELDFFLLVGILFSTLLFLAAYAALNQVNPSYALIALALGLISVAAMIPARPIMELFALSDLHAATTAEPARTQVLAAGEALLALFNGTAWAISTLFGALAWLTYSFIMLRSNWFRKATAIVGIISNTAAFFFFLPVVGVVLLFIATFGGLVWSVLLARDFYRIERKAVQLSMQD